MRSERTTMKNTKEDTEDSIGSTDLLCLSGGSNLSFFAGDSVTHKGVTNTWFTPEYIIKPLGEFDLDPCTQTFRPYDTAKRHICEDNGEDGLLAPWDGRVWLNPPYGKSITPWLDKMAHHGNGIVLVFNRTETRWAQMALEFCDGVNFLSGRVAFIPSEPEMRKSRDNAGTGSMLLAFGKENVESIRVHPGIIFQT